MVAADVWWSLRVHNYSYCCCLLAYYRLVVCGMVQRINPDAHEIHTVTPNPLVIIHNICNIMTCLITIWVCQSKIGFWFFSMTLENLFWVIMTSYTLKFLFIKISLSLQDQRLFDDHVKVSKHKNINLIFDHNKIIKIKQNLHPYLRICKLVKEKRTYSV